LKIKTRLQKNFQPKILQYPSKLLDTNCDSATLNYFDWPISLTPGDFSLDKKPIILGKGAQKP